MRVVQGGDTGLIMYHAVSRRAGEDEYRARMSSVYVRRHRRRQLLLHQQSPDPY